MFLRACVVCDVVVFCVWRSLSNIRIWSSQQRRISGVSSVTAVGVPFTEVSSARERASDMLRTRFVCAAGVLAAAIFRDPCMLLSGCAACVFLVYTMSVLLVQGVSNCPGKKSTAGLLLPFLRFRGFNLYARESGFLTQYARALFSQACRLCHVRRHVGKDLH